MSEPNYQTTKWFSENLLATEMKKTKVKRNKPLYLGQSILEISKIIMYKCWYDFVKPNHQDQANLRYMNTDSFLISICQN